MLYNYLPTPLEVNGGIKIGYTTNKSEMLTRKVAVDEPFSAVIFKTIVDPYMGKISLFKANSGVIKKDDEVLISNKGVKVKVGNISFFRGGRQLPAEEVRAGDIGAMTKIQEAQTGDTLCDKDNVILYQVIEFPKHVYICPLFQKKKVMMIN